VCDERKKRGGRIGKGKMGRGNESQQTDGE